VIDEVDKHFMKSLGKHEEDFKNAYKGQMLKVKREL
jgi:hypothetical protein